jgi:4-hydroxybenzoate polyprenyltransferase
VSGWALGLIAAYGALSSVVTLVGYRFGRQPFFRACLLGAAWPLLAAGAFISVSDDARS